MIQLVLTVSTSHMTHEDCLKLEKEKSFTVAEYEEGFVIVNVPRKALVKALGYSRGFQELVRYCKVMNVTTMVLDRDGEVLSKTKLPVYNW